MIGQFVDDPPLGCNFIGDTHMGCRHFAPSRGWANTIAEHKREHRPLCYHAPCPAIWTYRSPQPVLMPTHTNKLCIIISFLQNFENLMQRPLWHFPDVVNSSLALREGGLGDGGLQGRSPPTGRSRRAIAPTVKSNSVGLFPFGRRPPALFQSFAHQLQKEMNILSYTYGPLRQLIGSLYMWGWARYIVVRRSKEPGGHNLLSQAPWRGKVRGSLGGGSPPKP